MALALAAGICLPSYGCAGSGSGTLRVGVRSDIQYWGYYDENRGEYYGLEIDLARDLAKKLGYADVAFTTVDPTNREEKLENNEVDCIVACYSVTDERSRVVDFSPVYFQDHVKVLTMKSTLFTKVSDIVGMNIAYVTGTNARDKLVAKMEADGLITADDMKGTVFTEYSTYQDVFGYLTIGVVDAAVADGSIATDYLASGYDIIALDENISDENYAVATQKGSTLSSRMADAVNALLEDGTVTALIEKWYE